MLWAHQDPKCTLVSTVGVWHLTLCRASFWTMQTASKELNLQEKQSIGLNHAAKITPHNKINVELTYPWGGHTAWWITLGYRTIFLEILTPTSWLQLLGEVICAQQKTGWHVQKPNKQEGCCDMMELGCPWGIFQSYLDVCQCSLLLLWNICKRGAIQEKENCLRAGRVNLF